MVLHCKAWTFNTFKANLKPNQWAKLQFKGNARTCMAEEEYFKRRCFCSSSTVALVLCSYKFKLICSTFAKMPTGCFCCASACVFLNWLQVINVPYLCGFRSWNTMRSVCSSCKPLAMSSAIVTMSSSGSASPAKYRDKRHKSYLPGMFLHDKTSMMWGMRVNKHAWVCAWY